MPRLVETGAVVGVQPAGRGLWLVHLDLPEIVPSVRPGHLLLLRCCDPAFPTCDPYLPRAYFAFAADRVAGRLSLLVEERGRGSAWLCSRRPGDGVLAHGPVGREARPARLTRHLLLLGEGVAGVAGLALLAAEAVRTGAAVTLVQNVHGERGVPATFFLADVEYRATAPEAGGLLGTLPALLPWADEVIVAAAPPLLETLSALRRARLAPFTLHAGVPFQAIPLPDFRGETRAGGDYLPCGSGACGACAVLTGVGPRLFCREGPAFPLETLRFEPEPEPGDESAADER